MSSAPEPETVRINARQRADTSIYWEVMVRSGVRPRLLKVGILEFERRDQAEKIMVLAGALAEELCEQYHDTLDPGSVARAARDCYRELLSENMVLQPGFELPRDASPGSVRMANDS